MPRELITLQVGQCGNQIGWRFWDLALREHAKSSHAGLFDESMSTFFRNFDSKGPGARELPVEGGTNSIRFPRARAVLVDTEEGVVQQVLNGPMGELFDASQIIKDVSGAGNNWAQGHEVYGPKCEDEIMDQVHAAVECCDSPQSFFTMHSLGGGTGSGLGTYIIALLRDEYPDIYRFDAAVFPSEDDDVITSPYNSILALGELCEYADCVLPIHNEALMDICKRVDSTLGKASKDTKPLKGSEIVHVPDPVVPPRRRRRRPDGEEGTGAGAGAGAGSGSGREYPGDDAAGAGGGGGDSDGEGAVVAHGRRAGSIRIVRKGSVTGGPGGRVGSADRSRRGGDDDGAGGDGGRDDDVPGSHGGRGRGRVRGRSRSRGRGRGRERGGRRGAERGRGGGAGHDRRHAGADEAADNRAPRRKPRVVTQARRPRKHAAGGGAGAGRPDGRGTAFDSMNNIAAHLLVNLTASMRFEGSLNVDLNEITTNLVPFPNLHFIMSSLSPLYALADVKATMQPKRLNQMFTDAFSPHHQLIKADPRSSTYVGSGQGVEVSDIQRNIERLRPRLRMIRWNSEGFKVGLCGEPPLNQPYGLLALSNNCCISGVFKSMHDRFSVLYRRRAHLHHYTQLLDPDWFVQADETVRALVQRYNDMNGGGVLGGMVEAGSALPPQRQRRRMCEF